ncbi:MAG: hypothetical protein ABIP51_08195 [Bacteroidia bacterium]
MKNYIYFFALVICISCSTEKSKENDQLTTMDTAIVENTIVTNFPFEEKDFKKLPLPFTMDTLFIQKVDSSNRITYQQVRSLGINFLKSELGDGLSYDLNTFCEIDSLKQVGKYKNYVEHLDIGMTKKCIAFKLGLLDMGNNNKLFIWGIEVSSYEACPYFSGTKIIATFVNGEKETTHFTIAEISGGGDPPSSGNDQITAIIEADGKIRVDQISIGDDSDVPGIDITNKTYQLKIDGNRIVVVDTKTEEKSKEQEVAQ